MSPRQCIILPISEKTSAYCKSVYRYLHRLGYECHVDETNAQLNKKIRNAQLAQWNYILVAGEKEMAEGTISVRTRDNVQHGSIRVDELARRLAAEKPADSTMYQKFYEGAWSPDMITTPTVSEGEGGAVVEEVKAED